MINKPRIRNFPLADHDIEDTDCWPEKFKEVTLTDFGSPLL